MVKQKLLIATTNQGKFLEIKEFLETLPFDILSLNDVGEHIQPDESGATLEENAILKAAYYAEKTEMLTIADDTGFFIKACDGWPGIPAARIASTKEACRQLVLERMEGQAERAAEFRCALCLVDPEERTRFLSFGSIAGLVLEEAISAGEEAMQYAPIFYVPELQKAYSELTTTEKNSVSHRGKALFRMKYHLQNTYGAKHIVVPIALMVKDGKLFMQLRNDPHRPDFHRKWELPGGSMEFGESVQENLLREVQEETGYEVEIIKLLQDIGVEEQELPTCKYQVYLIPYVCRVIGGDGKSRDDEVLETRWFDIDDVANHELVGENKRIYEALLPELKTVITAYHL